MRPSRQGFTHEKVIMVYIHGIKMGLRNIKDIHRYCCEHLLQWFLKLPCYERFTTRIDLLGVTNLLFFITEKTAMFSKRSCCDRLGAYIYCLFKQRQQKTMLIKASCFKDLYNHEVKLYCRHQ